MAALWRSHHIQRCCCDLFQLCDLALALLQVFSHVSEFQFGFRDVTCKSDDRQNDHPHLALTEFELALFPIKLDVHTSLSYNSAHPPA